MNAAPTTDIRLICRLANAEDQRAWEDFVGLYEPVILRTALRLGLNHADARDAVQEALLHLARAVRQWRPTGHTGSFRSWLIRVARNQMLKVIQRTTMLRQQAGGSAAHMLLTGKVAPADEETWFNVEFRMQVFGHVVTRLRSAFSEKTWQAFWATYIDERSAKCVAGELGISVGAVYIARSRVMSRLRAEVKRLVDEQWESLAAEPAAGGEALDMNDIREAMAEP